MEKEEKDAFTKFTVETREAVETYPAFPNPPTVENKSNSVTVPPII